MKVNYKTVSTYEYDTLTGAYKKVDKEVEDTSTDFLEILSAAEESSNAQSQIASQEVNLQSQESNNSGLNGLSKNSYANKPNIDYRFEQNTDELSLDAKERLNQKDLIF